MKTRKPRRRSPKPAEPKIQTVDAGPLLTAVSQALSEHRAWTGGLLNAIRVDLERLEGCVRTVIDGQKQAGLHRTVDSSMDRANVVARAAVADAMTNAANGLRR